MKNHLASAPFYVEKQLISGTGDRVLSRHLLGLEDHLENDLLVLFLQVIDASDMSLWYDKQMNRRVGPDVLEDNQRPVLID